MRRDLDLVRSILKTAADSSEPMPASSFADDSHPLDLIVYHLEIMREAGLVNATILRDMNGNVARATLDSLTWSGNDFLDAVRSDSLWSKTKRTIATTIGAASFDVVKSVAVKIASTAVGL